MKKIASLISIAVMLSASCGSPPDQPRMTEPGCTCGKTPHCITQRSACVCESGVAQVTSCKFGELCDVSSGKAECKSTGSGAGGAAGSSGASGSGGEGGAAGQSGQGGTGGVSPDSGASGSGGQSGNSGSSGTGGGAGAGGASGMAGSGPDASGGNSGAGGSVSPPDASAPDAGIKCQNNCSGHGTCQNGKCQCNSGWTGFDCSQQISACPQNCNGHGTCSSGVCFCKTGYDGKACEYCKSGYDGYPNCQPCGCTLVSHTETADKVALCGATKYVGYACPEASGCVGGFDDNKTSMSLTFTSADCSKAQFVYNGTAYFSCSGMKYPTAVEVQIRADKGKLYWVCPSSDVSYSSSTGALKVNCPMNFTGSSDPQPQVLDAVFRFKDPKWGNWYRYVTAYQSLKCP